MRVNCFFLEGASKIAPHSFGLLAERVVLALEFFKRHICLYFTKASSPPRTERGPQPRRKPAVFMGQTLHAAGKRQFSGASNENRARRRKLLHRRMLLRLLDWLRHRARRRHWGPDREMGRRGEDLVHRFLRRRGYTVVARNYRTRSASGEVDLIAWDRQTLVFVEVKTRSSQDFGEPERAVDEEKRRRLLVAARDYCRRAGVDWARTRFDIASVLLAKPVRITLIKDAFSRRDKTGAV